MVAQAVFRLTPYRNWKACRRMAGVQEAVGGTGVADSTESMEHNA